MLFCHSTVGNAPPGLRRPPASPQPVLRPASGQPALPAAGPRRRAQTGRVAGDGQPALLGLLGGDCCLKSGFKRDERCLQRLIQKRLQRWRRCGGLLLGTVVQRETGAKACGRAGRCQGEGCCTKGAAGRAGGASRTQDRQSSPPIGGVRGDRRRRSRRRRRGLFLWERSETVRSPPGTVRPRTTQRLLAGHALEQSGVGPPRASDAGGSCGSPRPA